MNQPRDDDGFLRPMEIMTLKMDADMVAVTACQSGLGIGQSFVYAGAKTVLASLWSVEERSAVKLVELF